MPKTASHPDLQELVRIHLRTESACELGRVANLHRSTILRFCETGRATSSTAGKLSAALARQTVAQLDGVGLSARPTFTHGRPQTAYDLQTLRSMLQALITLIDGQSSAVTNIASGIAAPVRETSGHRAYGR